MRREVYPQDLQPGTKIFPNPMSNEQLTVVAVKHYKSKGGVEIEGTLDSGDTRFLKVMDEIPFVFWDDDNQ